MILMVYNLLEWKIVFRTVLNDALWSYRLLNRLNLLNRLLELLCRLLILLCRLLILLRRSAVCLLSVAF